MIDSPSQQAEGLAGCVILAAGAGQRMGAEAPKAFLTLGGRTLLERAVAAALASGVPGQIVVAVPEGWEGKARTILDAATLALPPRAVRGIQIVRGGAARSDSVALAESLLADDIEFVLVHDAARALAPPALFRAVMDALRAGARAVVPGLPVTDTIKVVDRWGVDAADREHVTETLDRQRLRAVQTPQGFRRNDLRAALADRAARQEATDDAQLVESLGARTQVIPGDPAALKITHEFDLLTAEAVLQYRRNDGHTPASH